MAIPRVQCPCGREIWDDNQRLKFGKHDTIICIYCLRILRFVTASSVEVIGLDALPADKRDMVSAALLMGRFMCPICGRAMGGCIDAGTCKRTHAP